MFIIDLFLLDSRKYIYRIQGKFRFVIINRGERFLIISGEKRVIAAFLAQSNMLTLSCN